MSQEGYPVRGVIGPQRRFIILRLDRTVLSVNGQWLPIDETPDNNIAVFNYRIIEQGFIIFMVDSPDTYLAVIDTPDGPELTLDTNDLGLVENTLMMPSSSVNNGWEVLVAGALYWPARGIHSTIPIMLFPLHLYGSDNRSYTEPQTLNLARTLTVRIDGEPTIPEMTVNYFTNPADARHGELYKYCYSTPCSINCKGPCIISEHRIHPMTANSNSDICQFTNSDLHNQQNKRIHPDFPEDRIPGYRCVYHEIDNNPRLNPAGVFGLITLVLLIGGFLMFTSMHYTHHGKSKYWDC